MYRLATTHSEKSNRRNFSVWSSHGKRGHVTHVTMAIADAAFSAVRLSAAIGLPYALRSAIGLLSDR